MTPCGTIMAVNWRTKLITELDRDGKVVKQFTSPEMQQPTRIAVNSKSDVIIADNTAGCLFIFDNAGRLVILYAIEEEIYIDKCIDIDRYINICSRCARVVLSKVLVKQF